MVFAQAFQKALVQKGENTNITLPKNNDSPPIHPEQIPMMYRAQIQGRCSLQYAKDNDDLNRWTQEWVYPNSNQTPTYQHPEPQLGLDGSIYRLKLKFPFRVFTNCGQDSLLRPTIGKNGIPFIPGSGIKGVFERLSRNPQVSPELQNKVKRYCGTPEHQGKLRFHGAYPIGDWAGTQTPGDTETRYRCIDVVHPQQERQVEEKRSPQAIAIVSFYQPTFIFELSSITPLPESEWQTIGGLLKRALRQGLGGKTSTGYGLCFIPQDRYPIWITLNGKGVSPLLRSDEPEFRPNLFKASLKGHVSRLLAGVSGDEKAVRAKVNYPFGQTTKPGKLQLYWESKSLTYNTQGKENTPTYQTRGTLHVDAPKSDLPFLQGVIEFTLTMGGLGKSWRRVCHSDFFPNYKTRAIGCHWIGEESSFERTKIKQPKELKAFLDTLRQKTREYLGVKGNSAQWLSWKEAWCPKRLTVYSQVVTESKGVKLFHEERFKTTPAIGGRKPNDNHPTSISFVWHRMLPIEGNKYLEIVTVFHGGQWDHPDWRRQDKRGEVENQFPVFIGRLKGLGFELTWGNEPTS